MVEYTAERWHGVWYRLFNRSAAPCICRHKFRLRWRLMELRAWERLGFMD